MSLLFDCCDWEASECLSKIDKIKKIILTPEELEILEATKKQESDTVGLRLEVRDLKREVEILKIKLRQRTSYLNSLESAKDKIKSMTDMGAELDTLPDWVLEIFGELLKVPTYFGGEYDKK